MNIVINQISNGWIVTVNIQGKGQSALYCKDFPDVLRQIREMANVHEEAIKLDNTLRKAAGENTSPSAN